MAISREEREILKAEIKNEMREELEQQAVNALSQAGVEPTFDLSSRQAWSGGEPPITGSIVEKYITFQKGVTDYNIPPSTELEGACLLNFKTLQPNKSNTFTPYSIEIDYKTGEVNIKLSQPTQEAANCIISFRK